MTQNALNKPNPAKIKGKLINEIKMSKAEFDKLSSFIYQNYGINLPDFKITLLESRLQKRLRVLNINSFKEYIKLVTTKGEHAEVVQMMNVVSTNKTDFFRESDHFDYISKHILPLYADNGYGKELKIWSAASSSGEEVYTLAIMLHEFMRLNNTTIKYHILGTDISTDVLEKAHRGIYDESRIAALPIELKKRYFLKSKDRQKPQVRVTKELRQHITFKRYNLMSEGFPSSDDFDIIFCRNVLIYFDKASQARIINKLCEKIPTGKYLFLGHSESIIGVGAPLKQLAHTSYQKI